MEEQEPKHPFLNTRGQVNSFAKLLHAVALGHRKVRYIRQYRSISQSHCWNDLQLLVSWGWVNKGCATYTVAPKGQALIDENPWLMDQAQWPSSLLTTKEASTLKWLHEFVSEHKRMPANSEAGVHIGRIARLVKKGALERAPRPKGPRPMEIRFT